MPEISKKLTVVDVRFKPSGKVYTFEIDGIDANPGMRVVVESEMGLAIATVVTPIHKIESTGEPIKKVLRIATEKDIETERNNHSLEEEAKTFCLDKVKERNLSMKIIGTETTLDRKRLIFYFTADGRIDFRELVRDLAAKFKTRIEMRQIGVRDEVKIVGGIGVCGRETCCSLFLTSFEPVTIRMAKKQELSINQGKLSGICGRLMCCLGYELEDLDEEKIPTSTIQDKPLETVTEEPSGTTSPDKFQCKEVCSCHSHISSHKKEEAVPSQPAQVTHSSGRNDESQRHKRKERGKPFSKRRNFWKKKKH